MSQIIRATLVSPSFQGMTWNVSGSGIATMSDSSIALKPVIDEPSKPIPSSSAAAISLGVTAKLFRCPSMSVNQSSRNSISSPLIRLRTSLRASGSLVALGLLSTCATLAPPFKPESPGRVPRPRPRRLRTGSVYNRVDGQLGELRLAAFVRDRAAVEAESRRDCTGAGGERGRNPPDVADRAEHRPAPGLADRVRLAADREHGRPDARIGDLLVQPDRVEGAGEIARAEDAEQGGDRGPRRSGQREGEHRDELHRGQRHQGARHELATAGLEAPEQPGRPREAEDHPDQPEKPEPDDRVEGPHRGEADVSQEVRLLEPV